MIKKSNQIIEMHHKMKKMFIQSVNVVKFIFQGEKIYSLSKQNIDLDAVL